MQLTHWTIMAWVVLPFIAGAHGSWGEPGHGQYHIQTDEGPERYFRFQTDNGQFRKERRLQDGTVIGTEAWIDAAGFLRQKDYIADTKGYRILKSKTIFVGHDRPVEDAIKSTKSVPAQSGVLVDGSKGLSQNSIVDRTQSFGSKQQIGYAYATTTTTTPIPLLLPPVSTVQDPTKLNYLSPEQAAKIEPSQYLGFDHYPDEQLLPPKLPSESRQRQRQRIPTVAVRTHSHLPIDGIGVADNTDVVGAYDVHSNSLQQQEENIASPIPSAPSIAIEPPYSESSREHRLRPIAVIESSARSTPPITAAEEAAYGEYARPTPFTAAPQPQHIRNGHGYNYVTPNDDDVGDSKYASPLDVNSLDGGASGGLLPPFPSDRYRHAQRLLNENALTDEYDGIATTRNGFRYVLPHQYHEEAQIDDKRAGSFGYVDPFGIRRVVYYNASPGRGFVHRNNNQYVGLNAPPYDPVGPRNSVN